MTDDIRDAAKAATAIDDSTVDPDRDGHGDPQELDDPDEEAVRRLLKGPPHAIGQVYRGAAGLDTKYPDQEAEEAAKDVPPADGDVGGE
jgi:hypothetical protein